MTIDIITYTPEQYAQLTIDQIVEVRSAQKKKEKRTAELHEALRKEEARFLKNGTYYSSTYAATVADLNARYEADVEAIREALLFYLQYSRVTGQGVGYKVDYSLSYDERVKVVRNYYETQYEDATERFQAFKTDSTAMQYLGERYAPLYDYYLVLTKS